MTQLENIAQKSDYQLKWMAANVSSYTEYQINAALEELKRRENIDSKAKQVNNLFKMLRDSIYRIFK